MSPMGEAGAAGVEEAGWTQAEPRPKVLGVQPGQAASCKTHVCLWKGERTWRQSGSDQPST